MQPRPAIQKDPLAFIDIFSGQEAYAPHVSLSYNNASYSLFRSSSSPSGDDEEVLLGDEEAGDHELFYANLETLIHTLHEVLPDLRGEGENEVILDFGPLDMQVSEVRRLPCCIDQTRRLTCGHLRTTYTRASYPYTTSTAYEWECASRSLTDCP